VKRSREPNAAMTTMLPNHPASRVEEIVEPQRYFIAGASLFIRAFDHATVHRQIIEQSGNRSLADLKLNQPIDLNATAGSLVHASPQ
jgi:hypothetical protein